MKLFEKGEWKLLWPFYLEAFVSTLFFIYPAFWIIQFHQHLTLTQIGFLFTAISVSSFLFEIPTGAFADIFGRKASVLLGYFLSGALVIAISFTTNFYALLAIFFLWGISGTFISGAKQSWVADNLKFNKKFNLLNNFFTKEYSLGRLALFFSGLIGALLVKIFGLDIIWAISGFSLILSGVILCFIVEHKITKGEKLTFSNLFTQSKKSINYGLKHKVLFSLFVALFFVSLWDVLGGDIVWQPFLQGVGFPIYAFGFLFSGLTLIGVIAPFFAKPLVKKIGKTSHFLALITLAQIIIVFLVLFADSWIFGVILLFLAFVFMDLCNPTKRSYSQNFIPSKMRATLTSFEGMIISLAFAITGPLAGYLGDTLGPKFTIVISGIFLIPAVIIYFKIKDRKR